MRAIYHDYLAMYDSSIANDPHPLVSVEDVKDMRPPTKSWMLGLIRRQSIIPKPSYGETD